MNDELEDRPRGYDLQKLVKWVALIAIACVLLVPYPTQLSPAISLQLVDEQGNGLPELDVEWSGGQYYYYAFERNFKSNADGVLELPAQVAWRNLIQQATSAIEVWNSNGFWVWPKHAYGGFHVPIGNDLEFDPACMGTPEIQGENSEVGRYRRWEVQNLWLVDFAEPPQAGLPSSLIAAALKPSESSHARLKFAFRRKTGLGSRTVSSAAQTEPVAP